VAGRDIADDFSDAAQLVDGPFDHVWDTVVGDLNRRKRAAAVVPHDASVRLALVSLWNSCGFAQSHCLEVLSHEFIHYDFHRPISELAFQRH
jgi:hypothetical protein